MVYGSYMGENELRNFSKKDKGTHEVKGSWRPTIALNNLWIIGLTMLLWFFGMVVFSYLWALVG
jgi:hypothetical protein